MVARQARLGAHAAFFVISGALGIALLATYPTRISAPQGYFLVAAHDAGSTAAFQRPKQVVVTVVDGLGAADARHTNAVRWFREHGRCFLTQVGSPSMSRPMYAVISSGVEQDRTGVRGNDMHEPAATRSVWEEARGAGWPVRAISSVRWWRDLFPAGFDDYLTPPSEDDYFKDVRADALNLVHVPYVDDAGHASGAGSVEYVASVHRVDAELADLIARTDLDTSLLVLTADHGQALRGGHGGSQPRVAIVMTCFAGKNVQPDARLGTLRATAIAPAIALLAGVPFPAHMRAIDDDLDTVLSLPRADDANRAYLADRGRAVARFRARNQEWLAATTGGAGSWSELYAHGRHDQWRRMSLALVILSLVLLGASRRVYVFWGQVTVAIVAGSFWVLRGSFDLTAMNLRASFVSETATLCFAVSLATILLFTWVRGTRADALRIQVPIIIALLGVSLAHVVVYGFTLGFPLPPPPLLFLPYFSSVALATQAVLGLLTCAFLKLSAAYAPASGPSTPPST